MAPSTRIGSSCSVCNLKIDVRYDDRIKCCQCLECVHLKCVDISLEQYQLMNEKDILKSWMCVACKNGDDPSVGENVDVQRDNNANNPSEVSADKALLKILDHIADRQTIILEKLTCKNLEPCHCSNAIEEFKIENEKLRATINAQQRMIAEMRNEFKDHILELKAMINNTSSKSTTDVRIVNNAAGKKSNSAELNHKDGGFVNNKIKLPPKQSAVKTSPSVCDSVASVIIGNLPRTETDLPKPRADKKQKSMQRTSAIEDHSPSEISAQAVREAITKAKCSSVIDLNQNVDRPHSGGINGSRSFVKRKNEPIIGDRPADLQCKLRAATSFTYWHVYRLHPDTKADDVVNYLKTDFPSVLVETLKSANPAVYSSFKVMVEAKDGARVSDPGLWPSGTRINRFFLARDKYKYK